MSIARSKSFTPTFVSRVITRAKTDPMMPTPVGILLACLWGLSAAAPSLLHASVRLAGLVVVLAGFMLYQVRGKVRGTRAGKGGLLAGLCCWFIAATLSCILNWHTDEVLQTYGFVFLAGAAVYWVLSGVTMTRRDLELAIVGLTVGSMFPLINGLVAFAGEWGTPDLETTVSAWKTQLRMQGYEAATFGNRGNTAAFLLFVVPVLLVILFDRRKNRTLRTFCGVALIPIALNLVILQVRAAFVILAVALVLIWVFRRGVKWLPVMAVVFGLGWLILFKFEPDVGQTMIDRMVPAITVDTEGDESVQERISAIDEGWLIAERHWLLGIGPGGALSIHSRHSAHQFHIQQAMETGIFGLVGALLFSFGLWASLLRTMMRGPGDDVNDMRFVLLIGPAAFVMYSTIANAALNNSDMNTWTVLLASMLALTPPFERHGQRVRTRVAGALNARLEMPPVIDVGAGLVPASRPSTPSLA